jgi:hypothetical protein
MQKQYVYHTIYASNPQGYIYNVNHPLINHLYRQYKERHNLPGHFPISDKERRRFEAIISRMVDDGVIVVRG